MSKHWQTSVKASLNLITKKQYWYIKMQKFTSLKIFICWLIKIIVLLIFAKIVTMFGISVSTLKTKNVDSGSIVTSLMNKSSRTNKVTIFHYGTNENL